MSNNTRYVVTEYVEGLKASFTTDGTKITSDAPDDKIRTIIDPITERLNPLFKDVKAMIEEMHAAADVLEEKGEPFSRPEIPRDFTELTLKGVITGGDYPHEDVAKLKDTPIIETAVKYCQDVTFLTYAIVIGDEEQDFYQVGALCYSFNIPTVPVLFFGEEEEAIKYVEENAEAPSFAHAKVPTLDAEGNLIKDSEGSLVALPPIEGNKVSKLCLQSIKCN